MAGLAEARPAIPSVFRVGLVQHLSNSETLAKAAAALALRKVRDGFILLEVERPGQRLLHESDIEQILKRYQGGESLRQLATAFSIHRGTVRAHLEQNGIARRQPQRTLTDELCTEMATQYRNGRSLAQLGERFGVHAKTVSNELRKLEVNIRPQGKNYRRD